MRAIAGCRSVDCRQRGSALVEFAVLAPVVGVLLAGLAAVAITVQAQLGLVSVAEEAALAATYAASPQQAASFGQQRGEEIGRGFALRNGSLKVSIDTTGFGPGGTVRATAHYQLSASQVPLLGLAHLDLEQRHAELVPVYRSLAGQP